MLRNHQLSSQMLATMRSFSILVLFGLVKWTNSQSCPIRYQRFSAQHSFCLPPNPRCTHMRTGVSQLDKIEILRLHNEFRSKVAMGNEHGAIGGSLPQVADMMQMEWDDELAAVAQKWTENCLGDHDCKECRAVENFNVGQNLAFKESTCMGRICREDQKIIPDWSWALNAFYNEVKNYHVDWLWSFVKRPGPKTSRMTQLIWSKSWRVGCGYTAYKVGRTYTRYYGCNYGPRGNSPGKSVYKTGPPCSACPVNSHCDVSGKGLNTYPGLCKMTNPNTAPVYRHDNDLFYCNSNPANSDCQRRITGANKWEIVNSVGGKYESVELMGGESTTITFDKPVVPHGKEFCIILKFRKGALDASNRDLSSLKGLFGSVLKNIDFKTTTFQDYRINMSSGKGTIISFSFSVPSGAPNHILDLREVMAFDGRCTTRTDY